MASQKMSELAILYTQQYLLQMLTTNSISMKLIMSAKNPSKQPKYALELKLLNFKYFNCINYKKFISLPRYLTTRIHLHSFRG